MQEYQVKVYSNRTLWFQNGNLHRVDGPAVEWVNGDKSWWENGKLHRADGPAVEYTNGNKYWYQNGKLHRDNGPAVECTNGDKKWYLNGKEVSKSAVMGHVITIDGKEVKISKESYEAIKGAV